MMYNVEDKLRHSVQILDSDFPSEGAQLFRDSINITVRILDAPERAYISRVAIPDRMNVPLCTGVSILCFIAKRMTIHMIGKTKHKNDSTDTKSKADIARDATDSILA
jgi:hypothetical protein